LAVHGAHRLAAQFPDGQIYVNLRGQGSDQLDPSQVLLDTLQDLGTDPAAIPDGLDSRSQLYRDRLSERRVLIVLDGAGDEAQVRPLLPGSASCAVLVTSRSRLAALEGANRLELDLLTPPAAVELLSKIVGSPRIATEPDAAYAIVHACGYLPLAVRIAGARLAARESWPLQLLAGQLRDERSRLNQLAVGDLDVRASLSLSYASQDTETQHAFRLLGILPALAFAAWPLAAALDCQLDQAERTAERLVDAQLLQGQPPDAAGQIRYQFHDLVRDYAREELDRNESEAARQAALNRILGASLWLTRKAREELEPGGYSPPPGVRLWPEEPDPRMLAPILHDAGAWHTAERTMLLSIVELAYDAQQWESTWELADSLATGLEVHARWSDILQSQQLGLLAAKHAGASAGEAIMRRNIANARRFRGEYSSAMDDHIHALQTFQANGNEAQAADTLANLAEVYREQGDTERAIDCLEQALAISRRLKIHREEAWAYQSLGDIAVEQGRLTDAETWLEQAATWFRTAGDDRGLAWTLRSQGDLSNHRGDPDRALSYYRQTLQLLQPLGNQRGLALTNVQVAELLRATGKPEEAFVTYQRSIEILGDLGETPKTADALLKLGDIASQLKRISDARSAYERSLTLFDQMGDSSGMQAAQHRLTNLT
jgi:tetratricopeptide (TPR) repeat protein